MDIILYDIGVNGSITPDTPLPPLPDIPRGSLVVVGGRAPAWRTARAVHDLHGSPAGAIATFDPRLGGVVVVNHNPDLPDVGQVVDVDWD